MLDDVTVDSGSGLEFVERPGMPVCVVLDGDGRLVAHIVLGPHGAVIQGFEPVTPEQLESIAAFARTYSTR